MYETIYKYVHEIRNHFTWPEVAGFISFPLA